MARLILNSLMAAFLLLAASASYNVAAAESPAAQPPVDSTKTGAAKAEAANVKETASKETVLEEISMDDGELDTEAPAQQPQSYQQAPQGQQLQPLSKTLMINTTKLTMPLEQVGNSITVIPRAQIQQMQATSLIEVLRSVPGIDISQNGSLGSTSSIFMRGMNSEHTLIMIDGVRLNDPISPGRSFNFIDQISPDAVERVEVMRGPQGPLYGTDGLGGVINIITRRSEGNRPSISARVLAGSYGTLQEDVSASGGLGEKLKSFVHFTRQDVRGFSSAGSRYGNRETDGFHNTSLMGRVEYTPFRQWTLDATTNYSRARIGLDNSGGFGQDDPNNNSINRVFTLSGGSKLKLLNDKFEQITRLTFTNLDRTNRNNVDPDHPFESELSHYRGNVFTLDSQNNIYLHRTNTLTTGINLQHEWGNSDNRFTGSFFGFPYTSQSQFSDRSITNVAFYAQDHIQLWNRWFTTLGFRSDHNNRFGHYNTYRVATSYIVRETGTTFKGSFGTGFKAPTVYQLYNTFGGNTQLNPETSLGWDVGVEQALLKNRMQLGTTVFQNQIKNMIQAYPPAYFYQNISRARTQGIEAYLTSQPFRNVQLRASYTYTDTKNLSSAADGDAYSGDPLLRRPRNKFSVNLNYQPHKKVNVNLDITHIGKRSDLDFATFPAMQVKLAAYTLVNLAVSYDVTKNINVFAKLVNILDTPYELAKGYGMPRFSAYGGLRLAL